MTDQNVNIDEMSSNPGVKPKEKQEKIINQLFLDSVLPTVTILSILEAKRETHGLPSSQALGSGAVLAKLAFKVHCSHAPREQVEQEVDDFLKIVKDSLLSLSSEQITF